MQSHVPPRKARVRSAAAAAQPALVSTVMITPIDLMFL
jgi:hypothetical protein